MTTTVVAPPKPSPWEPLAARWKHCSSYTSAKPFTSKEKKRKDTHAGVKRGKGNVHPGQPRRSLKCDRRQEKGRRMD